ncbi:hypothetical protein PAPYR_5888 [Paratrimastix pyriformis]|uniref:Protein kinase domain-containing protein n=1 Tax=Paratrimastix pyriformis TaxID=342808 RepID=A0ABQ8ULH9_9EUKA|nr:hypothetical protein PAPYR_5888 [Paratrimastix pyriformis]
MVGPVARCIQTEIEVYAALATVHPYPEGFLKLARVMQDAPDTLPYPCERLFLTPKLDRIQRWTRAAPLSYSLFLPSRRLAPAILLRVGQKEGGPSIPFHASVSLQHHLSFFHFCPTRTHTPANAQAAVNRLETLHGLGYLAVDVRPSNFMCKGSTLFLIDFGLALHRDHSLVELMGDPCYASEAALLSWSVAPHSHLFTPADDLAALVRVITACCTGIACPPGMQGSMICP